MNKLYTAGYKDEGPFFLSNFGQITRCVRIHGVHNEDAIDRNTEAIIEQTEMQHAESDESQVQFSGHSMMLERESNETQQLFKSESDETQEILTNQGSSIQRAITAQTNTMKTESDETQAMLTSKLQGIITELNDIDGKIDNAGIKEAIRALELVNNNYNYNTNNNYNN